MKCAVVILAGGEGRRIGGGKPGRPFAGRTLIDFALERAHSWSPLAAVAVRAANSISLPADIPVLFDTQGEGPIAGVASALHYAGEQELDAVLTIPCDAPLLPLNLLERLTAALGGRGAAVPSSGGRAHPTCALWRTPAVEALSAYLLGGRSSLMGFASAVGHAAVEWPIEPFDPFLNVNNEGDLAAAEALLRKR